MPKLVRINKPKTQRAKRALLKREPKIIENDKQVLFLKGEKVSPTVTNMLKDLYSLRKPLATFYQKKNHLRPFEDITTIEHFCQKTDHSLFVFGSHSRKRPHNVIFGRMFDSHLLDMFEFGITNYKGLSHFPPDCKVPAGTKPCLLFSGEPFESEYEMKELKNLFIDYFKGGTAAKIRLAGIQYVIHITATLSERILIRCYKFRLLSSGCHEPRIELDDHGPSIDLVIRRHHLASDDLYRRSRKIPKEIQQKKQKNITFDAFGAKLGRVHMVKQDLGKLQTRKMKSLKKSFNNESDSRSYTMDKIDVNNEPESKRPKIFQN